jgi:16S rRNA (uracil1498-N3)-methyltransferase
VATIHRFYVPGPLQEGVVDLPARIVHQCGAVLRLHPGDAIVLFDGTGGEWAAELVTVGRDAGAQRGVPIPGAARLLRHSHPAREPDRRITLGQALLKADRFEWVLQKGTELGVAAFQPLVTRRTVASGGSEADSPRMERWRRIVAEAAEQSGRCVVPCVAAPSPLAAVLARPEATVLLWEGERSRPFGAALERAAAAGGGAVRLLVGPEGGFDPEEAAAAEAAGAFSATLGPRILRSETAALAAVTLTCLSDVA